MAKEQNPWTDEGIERLTELMSGGATIEKAAIQLNRTADSIRAKWKRLSNRPDSQPPQSSPEVVAALPSFARAANVTRQPQAPQVVSNWIDPQTIGDKWLDAEQVNARHVEKARTRESFSVDFPVDEPIAIAFMSDQHIAKGIPVDLARMRSDAEYVRDTPNMFALLGGDFIDNHIKHMAAIISARSTPDDQWELCEYYLGIFAEKILAACSGNHCMWTNQRAGVDMVRWLTDRNKICYSPSGFYIEVTVCGQLYKIHFRHQFRMNSSFNKTHSVKQLWRLGDYDFDVGAIGHTHEAAIEADLVRGLERWYLKPGAYQITSAHCRQYGYNSCYPTCPTVILYPRTREMIGFMDMRKAGQFLRTLLR